MHLLLIRHGQSVNNSLADIGVEEYEANRLPDPPLTDLGLAQAKALGEWIGGVEPRPTVLYSSPMTRTLQTADPVSRALDLPILVRDFLHERPGPVEVTPQGRRAHPGSSRTTLAAVTPRAVLGEEITEEGWYREQIETPAHAVDRAVRIVEWLRTEHRDDDVVAYVGHGAIGALVLETILAPARAAQLRDSPIGSEPWWFDLANTSTSMVEMHGDRCEVHWINRVDHLVLAGLVTGATAFGTGNPGTR